MNHNLHHKLQKLPSEDRLKILNILIQEHPLSLMLIDAWTGEDSAVETHRKTIALIENIFSQTLTKSSFHYSQLDEVIDPLIELTDYAILLAQNNFPDHSLVICTATLPQIEQIDLNTLTDGEPDIIINQINHCFSQLILYNPNQKNHLKEQYLTFLHQTSPDNQYYHEMTQLIPFIN